jgi:hypothetical protein
MTRKRRWRNNVVDAGLQRARDGLLTTLIKRRATPVKECHLEGAAPIGGFPDKLEKHARN